MRKTVYTIIVILICAIIFFFSSQDGNSSTQVSSGITLKLLRLFIDYDQLSISEQIRMLSSFESIIRSLAHFSLFLILGFFSALMFKNNGHHNPMFTAFIFCVLYAISDELHQAVFVPGRAGQIVDLLKDGSGSLIGVGLISLYYQWKKKKTG
ncbi:MAG: VanZ family protein [Erysipelotrichaceae bacterium]